jgi:hypothetical protein
VHRHKEPTVRERAFKAGVCLVVVIGVAGGAAALWIGGDFLRVAVVEATVRLPALRLCLAASGHL